MIKQFSHSLLSDDINELELIKGDILKEYYLVAIYCMEGKMQVTVDDIDYLVNPGDLFVCIPQCIIGHYMRTPDFKGRLLCTARTLFNEVMSNCFTIEPKWWEKEMYIQRHPVRHLTDKQKDILGAYYHTMLIYADDEQTEYRKRIYQLIAQAMTFEVLNALDQKMEFAPRSKNSVPAIGVDATGQKDKIFMEFMDALNQPNNYQREVQVYAKQLLVSPKYLSAICRAKSDKNASEWIDTIMAGHIRHFLTLTKMSNKEIAYKMGFPDVSVFCKYVRRVLGVTPKEMRK